MNISDHNKLSDRIKAELPIEHEFRSDGNELRKAGSRLVCLCPFHQERTPSCYVNPDTGRWHCFGACGEGGTVIDYYAKKRGITPADAIKDLAARVSENAVANGCGHSVKPRSQPKRSNVPDRARALPKLPELHKGSARDLAQLALLRSLGIEALQLASNRGLLWFCDLKDGPKTARSWVIADRTRRNAQARRLDGQHWRHTWDAQARRWVPVELERQHKVRGFTGNQASWPVGIEEARSFNRIALVEGVDLLAVFHFLLAEDREAAVAPVAMLGASNRIPGEVLNLFTGKRVRMFPHADANHAGLRAAVNWEAQLRPVVAYIDAFDLTGLRMTCGSAVKDLNDLTSVDPDCFESEPELRSIMHFNESNL
jgi:hypothetical protein